MRTFVQVCRSGQGQVNKPLSGPELYWSQTTVWTRALLVTNHCLDQSSDLTYDAIVRVKHCLVYEWVPRSQTVLLWSIVWRHGDCLSRSDGHYAHASHLFMLTHVCGIGICFIWLCMAHLTHVTHVANYVFFKSVELINSQVDFNPWVPHWSTFDIPVMFEIYILATYLNAI